MHISDTYRWREVIGSRKGAHFQSYCRCASGALHFVIGREMLKGGTLSRCAIGIRLAARSVLPAENQTRDQYKPVTAIGTM